MRLLQFLHPAKGPCVSSLTFHCKFFVSELYYHVVQLLQSALLLLLMHYYYYYYHYYYYQCFVTFCSSSLSLSFESLEPDPQGPGQRQGLEICPYGQEEGLYTKINSNNALLCLML